MHLEQMIFAIDNDNCPHTVAKFLRHCDTERALMRMPELVLLIGCYNGVLERSYMIPSRYRDKVKDYIKGQQSVLFVPSDTRQECVLEYLECGSREGIGPMREVSCVEAMKLDGWTYVQDTGKYYTCG